MTELLELQLVKQYPEILQEYKGDPRQTCMAFGIECADGWYQLLYTGMKRLQRIAAASGVQTVATQIKEKYGTLRFYYTTVCDPTTTPQTISKRANTLITKVIDTMEEESGKTCEVTGKPGKTTARGQWLRTLCEEEAKKDGYSTEAWRQEREAQEVKKTLMEAQTTKKLELY